MRPRQRLSLKPIIRHFSYKIYVKLRVRSQKICPSIEVEEINSFDYDTTVAHDADNSAPPAGEMHNQPIPPNVSVVDALLS